jgi:hypothetical protein
MPSIALLFALCALAAPVDNPFRLEARDVSIAPGETGAVSVYLVVPPKHHVFRDVLQVTVTDASGLVVAEPIYPPGVMAPDTTGTNGGLPRESYEADVIVDVPVTVPAGTPLGERDLGLHVRYQGCNEKSCFFPRAEDLRARVNVRTATVAPTSTTPRAAPPASPATPPPVPASHGCATHGTGGVSMLALALALTTLARGCRPIRAGRRPGAPTCRTSV